jgi:hypothetical protein
MRQLFSLLISAGALLCPALPARAQARPEMPTNATGVNKASPDRPTPRNRPSRELTSDAAVNPATGATFGSSGTSMGGDLSGPIGFDSTVNGERGTRPGRDAGITGPSSSSPPAGGR